MLDHTVPHLSSSSPGPPFPLHPVAIPHAFAFLHPPSTFALSPFRHPTRTHAHARTRGILTPPPPFYSLSSSSSSSSSSASGTASPPSTTPGRSWCTTAGRTTRWGQYTLNPADPYSLKLPGFNPRAYKLKNRFLKLCCFFTCNFCAATLRCRTRRSASRLCTETPRRV
jgi:hypothetical protein